MKKVFFIILFLPLISTADTPYNNIFFSSENENQLNPFDLINSPYVKLDANNIKTWVWKRGIFNLDTIPNTAGFEWPKGSGKKAVYSSGLSIGALINGQIRIAAASYRGEYVPGYS